MQRGILNRILRKIFKKENRLFLYLTFSIIIMLFLSAYAKKWSSNQTIESFIITGNKFVPTDELLGNVDSSLIECIRNDVELIDLKEKIVKHPYVLNSFIMQKNSTCIEIEVMERKPVAVLIKNDGSLCYCDVFGTLLPYRLSLHFSGLPLIRNTFVNDVLDSSALDDAIGILMELKKPDFFKIWKNISEIDYDRKTNSFLFLTLDDSYTVYFGKAENMKAKLDLLCDFYESAIQDIKPAEIRCVDVRWDNRIIVQLNQHNESNAFHL